MSDLTKRVIAAQKELEGRVHTYAELFRAALRMIHDEKILPFTHGETNFYLARGLDLAPGTVIENVLVIESSTPYEGSILEVLGVSGAVTIEVSETPFRSGEQTVLAVPGTWDKN